MQFHGDIRYRLELSSAEMQVLLVAIHGGTLSETDQVLLKHLQAVLTQGIAGVILTEQKRFFQVPEPVGSTEKKESST